MKPLSSHPLYGRHSMDSAISALWDFYKRNFIVLFSVSFVLSLITGYASTLIDLSELQSMTDPQEMLLKIREFFWPVMIISVISLLFSSILHYYVIFNPLDSGNDILNSFLRSLRYFIPYLIIVVLFSFFGSLVLVLGIFALVIGVFFAALYIFMIFLFILPVLMTEGPLIANAITRTFRLAHRSFWANMGWTAAFAVILLVISIILSGLVLIPFTGSFLRTFTDPQNAAGIADLSTKPLYIILSAAASALTFPLLPVFACILFFNGKARENKLHVDGTNAVPDDDIIKPGVEDLYAKPLPEEEKENESL